MAGPIIDIRFNADEVIAVINSKRRKLRTAVEAKMKDVVQQTADLFLDGQTSKVGLYIDPKTVEYGVTGLGSSTVIGYVEANDKSGGYDIYPVNAKFLVFIAKSGDIVRTKHVFRPYLKTSKFLPEHLIM